MPNASQGSTGQSSSTNKGKTLGSPEPTNSSDWISGPRGSRLRDKSRIWANAESTFRRRYDAFLPTPPPPPVSAKHGKSHSLSSSSRDAFRRMMMRSPSSVSVSGFQESLSRDIESKKTDLWTALQRLEDICGVYIVREVDSLFADVQSQISELVATSPETTGEAFESRKQTISTKLKEISGLYYASPLPKEVKSGSATGARGVSLLDIAIPSGSLE